MSSHDKTLKLVMNLDRPGVEAQIETQVTNALKWLKGKPEHEGMQARLELVELNLPNLK